MHLSPPICEVLVPLMYPVATAGPSIFHMPADQQNSKLPQPLNVQKLLHTLHRVYASLVASGVQLVHLCIPNGRV